MNVNLKAGLIGLLVLFLGLMAWTAKIEPKDFLDLARDILISVGVIHVTTTKQGG